MAIVAFVAAIFSPRSYGDVFGTSYTQINTTTKANLTDQDSKIEEELWVKGILFGSDLLYQDNPFADGMTGAPGSGKPVTVVNDTTKVAGSTINIPVYAGFAGPGVSGNGDRYAALQKVRQSVFQVVIGRHFFGYGIDSVAKEETLIGGVYDRLISGAMKQQVAKKKNDDHLMRLRATATVGGRNHMFPEGVTALADLRTSHTLSTALISQGQDRMTSLGGRPVSIGAKDSGGSNIEEYMLFAPHPVLRSLDTESAYLEGRLYADARGASNGVFKGNYNSWNGTSIYRWNQKDHGNDGPIGSPLMPRAYLRTALTGANTGSFITGGGSTASVTGDPTKKYFEFFSNAPYTYSNGQTIAADTTTDRYVMIINNDGTGWNVYSYEVNDGNKITILARMALGLTGETTNWNHPAGSLVVECNSAGVPFGYSLFLGGDALVCGHGSINGKGAYGTRQQETKNLGMDHAIGIEYVWGNAVVERADGVKPGVIVAQTAFPVAGAPIVT